MTSGDGEETVTVGAVRFLGARRSYWRLLVRGAVLLMLTLGIYRFWLMTDVRRFLWTNTEIAGESLEYAGTALELLLGFLVAVALLIPLYAGFFVGALELGPVGQVSGLIAFLALFVLGQYAIYRARRYRLTRTVYRGLRFHQSGSAWGYAFRAIAWWAATILTFGLAYPFQLASLERFKMENTWYGDLAGRFEGRGISLLLRGFPIWLLVVGPLLLAVYTFVDAVDWKALADTLHQGGDDMMARLEGSNSGFGMVVAFAMLMAGVAVTAAALLYPAFQAIVLRWWSSGLRFGDVELRSKLRMRDVYGAYARFLGYALAFSRHRRRRRAAGAGRDRLADRSRPRHRRRACRHRHPARRLRHHRARLLDHLSRHRAAVALADRHGIAAPFGPDDARAGKGNRTGEFGAGRRPRRRAQCRWLLAHDPEKHALDPDRGWTPVFGQDHAQTRWRL